MTDIKKLILARRARFLVAAVAGAGLLSGCSEDEPQVCLTIAPGVDGGDGASAEAQMCLSVAPDACLAPPFDVAVDAPQPCLDIMPDASDEDAMPQMCLAQPPPDAGVDDAEPEACLSQPYEPDAG
jgi:hypothetical protein